MFPLCSDVPLLAQRILSLRAWHNANSLRLRRGYFVLLALSAGHDDICSAMARSHVAERRPRLCLDRPDRPIFQRAREPILDPNERIIKEPVESRRQVRLQRRLNFRDSIGCFETSRLVVPLPCSSPSCHKNPAKRAGGPSGQAQPGSHLDPTLTSGLPTHHSRAAKLVAPKTRMFSIYLQHNRRPAFVNMHSHVSR